MGIKCFIKNLISNYKNPHWWQQLIITYTSKLQYRNNEEFAVLSEDWDYLIILDACRFDIFSEEIRITTLFNKGKLEYRFSQGTETPEFLLKNFGNGVFMDIVYITANPFVDMLLKGKFYKIIPVWKNGWDEKLNTVHPKTMYEYTLRTLKKYPNKRFIIHFMQPHFPYLTLKLQEETGFSKHREAVLKGNKTWKDVTIWDLVRKGVVNIETVKNAYKENLRITLTYVEKLVNHLTGRIVITSDHGEAFGERFHPLIPIKIYGHPKNVRIEALIKVPWFVIEKEKKTSDEEKQKISTAINKFLRKEKLSKKELQI